MMTRGHEILHIKAHHPSEHTGVGALYLTEARHHASYAVHVASKAPNEASHFTGAVSASFLYVRVTPCHPQGGTTHFSTFNLVFYTDLSVRVLTCCKHHSFHRENFVTLHHYHCFYPSSPDKSFGAKIINIFFFERKIINIFVIKKQQ